jgi:hypothetical protein
MTARVDADSTLAMTAHARLEISPASPCPAFEENPSCSILTTSKPLKEIIYKVIVIVRLEETVGQNGDVLNSSCSVDISYAVGDGGLCMRTS